MEMADFDEIGSTIDSAALESPEYAQFAEASAPYSPPPQASRPDPRRRMAPPPVDRCHDALVALQAADGAWDLTEDLVRTLGMDVDDLLAALQGAGGDPELAQRALATALALAWLEKHAGGARTEWEMLAGKAWRWLTACSASPAGGGRWIDLASRIV
jgi:hypothetical protein